MISTDQAIRIHSILIEKFGGLNGLRDRNLLDAALSRPYQTFDNRELYPTPPEKAAALIESILMNHPFLDGNKRFGYVAMRLTLMSFGMDIRADEKDKYILVLRLQEEN
ncbi:MAG: type II toxin-antitoxin system death-on-curing family toxin [Bacteroidota bacterium]